MYYPKDHHLNVQAVLVQKDNYRAVISQVIQELSNGRLVGFDIESHDNERHDGLNQFMGLDPKGVTFKKPKKLVFDVNRTTVTGFSIYIDQGLFKYYFNLNQADVENRIPWEDIKPLLLHIKGNHTWVCHNFAFEQTMMSKCYDFDLGTNYIDTMQMAVSAYNADEYDPQKLFNHGLGEIKTLFPAIAQTFKGWENGREMDTAQMELFQKVIGKQSVAAHSYNGLVREVSYGYGLKKAVKSFFGFEMDNFEDTLIQTVQVSAHTPESLAKTLGITAKKALTIIGSGEEIVQVKRPHMGWLTGQEVLNYGADDSYWCIRLFHALYHYMASVSAELFPMFMRQENPMPYIFSARWQKGIRVNLPAIKERQALERSNYTKILRELKAHLVGLGDFPSDPSQQLSDKQPKWYLGVNNDGYVKYRDRWNAIRYAEDGDDMAVALQVSGAISQRWLEDLSADDPESALFELQRLDALAGKTTKPNLSQLDILKKLTGHLKARGNITHYMMQRVLLHDLCDIPLIYIKGNIATDAEARGKMVDKVHDQATDPKSWLARWKKLVPKEYFVEHSTTFEAAAIQHVEAYALKKEKILGVLKCLNKLTEIDTRMKLYINPYLLMTDPDTHRMYPTINSLLNTRRMAAQNPNPMQLSKRGESVYVRGFFLPDDDDEVLVSVDWTAVELVLIGDQSKDPAFYEAYGQKPFRDLHGKAAASAIAMYHPEFTAEDFEAMKQQSKEEVQEIFPQALINPVTKALFESGAKAAKFWRGDAGKASNFGYWYSGNLMTVQDKLNWTVDQMWEATENYRQTFAVAEKWRQGRINECRMNGSITLPDGHRRVRFEATHMWKNWLTGQFAASGNEAITNFGAEVAKRVSNRAGNQTVNADIQGSCATLAKRSIISLTEVEDEYGASFWMPIHDELVYSVKKVHALEWIQKMKDLMCSHPEIVKFLMLDGTGSIGLTLEPFDEKKAPYGQIELDEYRGIKGLLPEECNDQALSLEQQQVVLEYLS